MPKFSRIKILVRDYGLGFGIGVVSVLGMTLLLAKPQYKGVINKVVISPEQLKHLIQNPEAVISFNVSPKEIIWVTNKAAKEVL